jgi:hypothetical protein
VRSATLQPSPARKIDAIDAGLNKNSAIHLEEEAFLDGSSSAPRHDLKTSEAGRSHALIIKKESPGEIEVSSMMPCTEKYVLGEKQFLLSIKNTWG